MAMCSFNTEMFQHSPNGLKPPPPGLTDLHKINNIGATEKPSSKPSPAAELHFTMWNTG